MTKLALLTVFRDRVGRVPCVSHVVEAEAGCLLCVLLLWIAAVPADSAGLG